MPKVSIIIVTYNNQDAIKPLLDSLKSVHKIAEVIVVDNNSADQTVEELKKYLEVAVIESDTNLGFGRGCNLGAKKAAGEFLFFLNPDTVLRKNSLETLVTYLEDHKEVGIVAPKVMLSSGGIQPTITHLPGLINAIQEFIFGQKNAYLRYSLDVEQPTEVDAVYGAAILLRRQVYEKLDGFDEKFFMYYEDIDLCRRIHRLNLKIIYIPSAIVTHELGASGKTVKTSSLPFGVRTLAHFIPIRATGTAAFQVRSGIAYHGFMIATLIRLTLYVERLKMRLINQSTIVYLILLLILILPTFWTLLKPGLYSMQDYHTFRLYEFNKCITDLQIPCRWTPDATYEYGQPTFIFYGQLTFIFGQLFRIFGASVIDTLKALSISTVVLSAVAMFFLARQLWKNNLAGLVVALVYTYAPYRAVDLYVRGDIPESFSFVFFPLITYLFNSYLEKPKLNNLILFSFSLAGLALTHNLSVLVFLLFFGPWVIYSLSKQFSWKLVVNLGLSLIIAIGLAAFYLVPIAFESQHISLGQILSGSQDYHVHFATINQLLLSRFWGYGGSGWGENDGLSLAVGQLQWILPLIIIAALIWKKSLAKYREIILFLVIGWLALFMIHNKSVDVWQLIPGLSFLQFPWRFLGLAIFCFSLVAGVSVLLFKNDGWRLIIALSIIGLVIGLNVSFFKEGKWSYVTDQQLFSGVSYQDQITSSYKDYWPNYGSRIPTSPPSQTFNIIEGSGSGQLVMKNSNSASYMFIVNSSEAVLSPSIVYFPGWSAMVNGQPVNIYPSGPYGLITVKLPAGASNLNLNFRDTWDRSLGNWLSLITLVATLVVLFVTIRKKR